METIVQKYGGSSVADVEKIRRVAAAVVERARGGARLCVVVSAMGDTTDELLALARRVTPSPQRRELDMLVSCGERISMALLAMAIQEHGVEAISFTGSQSGIITDERHSGARVVEVRPARLEEALAAGKIVIVAGFQGVSRTREVTTLGRGGSDTTAVALAAALGASACEIYSDVEGIWTGDPRHVPAARQLESVSYEEMFELAEHGARVLNQQAVEWARRAGIVIHARKTGSEGAGTRVEGTPAERRATGVASSGNLVRLRLSGPDAPARLCAAMAEHGLPVRQVAGRAEASALFALDDVPDWVSVRAALRRTLDGLEIDEGIGTATVVGHGVGAKAAAISQSIAAARCAGAEVLGVDATPLRITLVVPEPVARAVAAALHEAFLGQPT